jgi:hypothetical protein
LEQAVPPSDAPVGHDPVGRASPSASDDLGFLFAEFVRDLPEFVPRYMELVEAGDDDPGEPTVLMELAEFVAARLAVVAGEGSAVGRALGLIEATVRARAADTTACELVGYAFFDNFTVEERRLLTPVLGPRSLELLESLEVAPEHGP